MQFFGPLGRCFQEMFRDDLPLICADVCLVNIELLSIIANSWLTAPTCGYCDRAVLCCRASVTVVVAVAATFHSIVTVGVTNVVAVIVTSSVVFIRTAGLSDDDDNDDDDRGYDDSSY